MERIAILAGQYPNVNIVLDHIGFPVPETTPTFGLSPQHLALASHPNVYYKYTNFLIELLHGGRVSERDFLDYAVSIYGADHMIWGSDIGNTDGRYSDLVRIALASASRLTIEQKQALFYDTAKGLFIPGGRGPASA
jgi:predicted TIM-barrel fold metal-dependent hydrolase